MSKYLSNSESAFVSSKNISPPLPSSSASAFLSHQEGGEISAYAEINFRIYSDKFSYIRKYISLYTQIYFSIYTTKRGSEYCSGTLQLQKNAPTDKEFDKWSVIIGSATAVDKQPGEGIVASDNVAVTALWKEKAAPPVPPDRRAHV